MMPKKKQSIKKEDYEDIYDCIVTDQVPPNQTAEYLDDMGFYKYYMNRKVKGSLWKKDDSRT